MKVAGSAFIVKRAVHNHNSDFKPERTFIDWFSIQKMFRRCHVQVDMTKATKVDIT
jgi:hypothetical protein